LIYVNKSQCNINQINQPANVTVYKKIITTYIFTLFCALLFAQHPVITITDASKNVSIDDKVSILNCRNIDALNIEDVVRLDSLFKPNPNAYLKAGDWFERTNWYRIVVENNVSEHIFLSVLPSITDTVEVYKQSKAGWDVERTGKLVAFKGHNISTPNHIMELKCNLNEKQTFYIHLKSFMPFRIKLSIAANSKILAEGQFNSLINSFILGFIFFVCFLSSFFYVIHKEHIYLWFTLFLVSMVILSLYHIGYWHTLLFSNSYWLNYYSPFVANLPGLFAIKLSLSFSKTDNSSHILPKFLKICLIILMLNLVIGGFYSLGLCILIVYIVTTPVILTTILSSYRSHRDGDTASKYYILSFVLFSLYMFLYFLDDSGLVPQLKLSNNVFLYAVGIEATMLLISILNHVNNSKKDKEKTDAQLIESLEAQRIMMCEHNNLLEKQVNERTRALTETLSKLEQKEEELNLYADRLKKSNNELMDFASIISHDLKAPLRNTTSFLQLLLRRNKDKFDATDNEYVDFIVKSSAQSVRLVDDLLNYSKLDKNIGESENIDFKEIVSNYCLTLKTLMESRNATIVLETIPDIQAHRSLIVMLMQNLITNGIKYNGTKDPQIKIGHFKNIKNEDVFYVQDNGIGIAQKYQDEVFKMFRRLHTKDTYEGTGIGLAFVKRIIDHYKGRIWFESTEGAGTTFFFTLPDASNVQLQSSDLIHA
jgi:signal transduction histidine kinase